MTSEPVRDPFADHLLTPQNCALIIIDYQPVQVSSIKSMEQEGPAGRLPEHSDIALEAYSPLGTGRHCLIRPSPRSRLTPAGRQPRSCSAGPCSAASR